MCNKITHDEAREMDLQKLCSAVLHIGTDCWDNPNKPFNILYSNF